MPHSSYRPVIAPETFSYPQNEVAYDSGVEEVTEAVPVVLYGLTSEIYGGCYESWEEH